jgi:hypothetical protein
MWAPENISERRTGRRVGGFWAVGNKAGGMRGSTRGWTGNRPAGGGQEEKGDASNIISVLMHQV